MLCAGVGLLGFQKPDVFAPGAQALAGFEVTCSVFLKRSFGPPFPCLLQYLFQKRRPWRLRGSSPLALLPPSLCVYVGNVVGMDAGMWSYQDNLRQVFTLHLLRQGFLCCLLLCCNACLASCLFCLFATMLQCLARWSSFLFVSLDLFRPAIRRCLVTQVKAEREQVLRSPGV